ncbi:hypothetical protein [Saccharomonospora azurea]|uniref:hypothetical protein n=1 Tax=Saccharomonospora azurea TaxID=40988 RepID=UPI00022E2179|nr:hypothetical protein [Saccharomonospora azurea]
MPGGVNSCSAALLSVGAELAPTALVDAAVVSFSTPARALPSSLPLHADNPNPSNGIIFGYAESMEQSCE